MIDGSEKPCRFLAGRDIARMLVLDADDEAAPAGLFCELAQRRCNPIETRVRIDGAPVREHADNPGAHPLGDFERAAAQAVADP